MNLNEASRNVSEAFKPSGPQFTTISMNDAKEARSWLKQLLMWAPEGLKSSDEKKIKNLIKVFKK